MCGITGIFDTRSGRAIASTVLHAMNESQHHRGPDEGSMHLELGVGLGHRRFPIIDMANGQQPPANEVHSSTQAHYRAYELTGLIRKLDVFDHQGGAASCVEVIGPKAFRRLATSRLAGIHIYGTRSADQSIRRGRTKDCPSQRQWVST